MMMNPSNRFYQLLGIDYEETRWGLGAVQGPSHPIETRWGLGKLHEVTQETRWGLGKCFDPQP